MTALDRYLAYTTPQGNCRIWTRAAQTRRGIKRYGNFVIAQKSYTSHRYFYEAFVGPIPAGKQLHHLCCNSLCQNPSHLRIVGAAEHTEIEPSHVGHRTQCPHGHVYTPENTKRVFAPGSNGKRYWKRVCRACHKADNDRRRTQQKAHG